MTVWLQNPFDNLPFEGYRKQRYWLMAEAFVRAGHRVVLWTSDFNHTTKTRRTLPAELPFEVRLVPTRPYASNVSFARLASHRAYARAWTRLAEACVAANPAARPDLIVTSVPTLSAAAAAQKLAHRLGARVVADVQDAWPETFERLFPRALRFLAHLAFTPLRWRARRIYRTADAVTGVCDRYRALTGRADYSRTYLGVELPSDLASRPDRPLPLRLVYAGNLGRTYDLATVIRGVALLREDGATLDVAGEGPGVAAGRALAASLGLADRVRFHGYLAADALRALFADCTIGVVPMAEDSYVGVPNKFADYAAAGLAIVSSLGGESAALLARYGCGETYAPGDPASFAAAVRRRAAAGTGDTAGLAREFDAVRLYDRYVRHLAGVN